MEPNNIPQQVVPPSPAPVVVGGLDGPTAPNVQVPQQPTPHVKPNNTNYAAAVFFTLLVIGFTFHLPSLLYGPVIFFCIVAGILLFKDLLTNRRVPQPIPGQPGAYYPVKKRSIFVTLLLVIFGAIGLGVLGYIGLIIFLVVMFSASGV